MEKLQFNKKRFNEGYAIYYTIGQAFFIIGFLFIVLVLILPANTFSIPDELSAVVCGYLICSIAGFPILTIVKIGKKRLLVDSELKISKKKLYYNMIKERICPSLGGVEERYIFQVDSIVSVKVTRRYYCVTGEISMEIINNGRLLEKKNITMVRIPNSYEGIERMIQDE